MATSADLALIVIDAAELLHRRSTGSFVDDYLQELDLESCTSRRLVVVNKRDLLSVDEEAEVQRHLKGIPVETCLTSCSTQQGIGDLVKVLAKELEALCGKPAESSPVLTQARHRTHLEQCLKHLQQFSTRVRDDSVIGAEHLRIALTHIGKITGRVFTEEILDVIFRDFCIGK